ncbi:hypothetical protein ERICIV_02461 [Paenibacillus larvae subsp. larvae]|uniref:Uncharacterized protein n=9 Tax=root TaxID=1 RepID=A0A345KQI7_9CAUD|nr:hypothetical protein [Paenibacillus larvae]YP_009202241.1 hypothetical protein AVV24_gp35 [Bacteriophage Lily]YP_009838931.1 hypothetical protein HWB74_gp28 [Paenibacillus phage Jacopo]AXF40042.1 hypothetical protein BLOOM_28 [Paenibacillus phage Bloom]AXF40401.1 hypothetical protein LYCANUS1_28 [Paenibacillus phage Genki]AXF42269.1 hypothetical protein LYCANUS2_28 [Paenibacillus phage Gryphonian]AXH45289.1 hypothetical protein ARCTICFREEZE_28 [Paenibacillus phage Arcticfreeze]AXH45355.1 
MNTIYKVNQSRGKSVAQIAEILNNCELLLRLEIEDLGSKIVLHVITDSAVVQYTEVNKTSMIGFLSKLREYAIFADDIDDLLEEVQLWEE